MKFVPHEYQAFAVRYLESHPVAAAMLDMGLGKTVITLTAIASLLYDSFEVRRVLVVAPLRVAKYTWPEEIRKWDHLSELRFAVAVGTSQERIAALKADVELVIINRENLDWLMHQDEECLDFDMAVLDELSSFRHYSGRTKAFLKLRPRLKRVVGLTGTPGDLLGLHYMYRCLDRGARLGTTVQPYRARYFYAKSCGPVFRYYPYPWAKEEIYKKIADITISMKATEYLDMPELISTEYPVWLDEDEAQTYDDMKENFLLELKDDAVTASNAAVLTGKLLQMANGMVYTDDRSRHFIHDRKLDALEDILEAAAGKPILLVYWFQHDLERITELLEALKLRYARILTPESVEQWNNGELEVGLIHPASAGHGLNLQSGGSHIVWFGLTWSLELYQQTNARLWRQGQQSGTVVIQHIICRGTIDEKVLRVLRDKEDDQDALIEAVRAVLS